MAVDRLQPQSLIGADLSEGMLSVGREKVERAGKSDIITLQKEDCMALSFEDNTFDAVTVAYGVRNFEDLDRGLREMLRVLKPGGRLVIIELTSPVRFPMKQLFWLYAHVWMPMVGNSFHATAEPILICLLRWKPSHKAKLCKESSKKRVFNR